MNIKDVTIFIPTSVIPDHPSTSIVDQTISNIRYHFPDNEIILQVDGLREEQKHRKNQYDEYKNRLLWNCLHKYNNVLPIIFDEHEHQSSMMKKTISLIKTSLLFYIEGDLPIRVDREINWNKVLDMLDDSSMANTIRFYLHEQIPKEHKHLMHEIYDDFIQTTQWSQNPHISRVDYYVNKLLPNIPDKSYIENHFYATVENDPWEKHKAWIYRPNNGNLISRCVHLDGRKNLKKFNEDDEAWGLTET